MQSLQALCSLMQPFIRAASIESGFIKKSFLDPGKKVTTDNALRRSLAQLRDEQSTRHHPYTSRAQKWMATSHKTVSDCLGKLPLFKDKDDAEVLFRGPEWIFPISINKALLPPGEEYEPQFLIVGGSGGIQVAVVLSVMTRKYRSKLAASGGASGDGKCKRVLSVAPTHFTHVTRMRVLYAEVSHRSDSLSLRLSIQASLPPAMISIIHWGCKGRGPEIPKSIWPRSATARGPGLGAPTIQPTDSQLNIPRP